MGTVLSDNLERNKRLFIEKATNTHKEKYDYSLIDYKNTHTKVIIICPEHGKFEQSPSRHLNSKGCNKCRILKYSSLQAFLDKAKKIYGDKYDYSQVSYINNDTPVSIICPIHGPFITRPRSHTSAKSGCPKCWKVYDQIPLERAKEKFKGKFEYPIINGVLKIICPKHGDTKYSIHDHLKTTYGCAKCYEESRRISTKEYLNRAQKTHSNKYQYPNIQFSSMADIVKISCPQHGIFEQTAGAHLYEQKGCWLCSHAPLTTKEFVEKADKTHNNKYDYSKVCYANIDTKVCIICPEHGEFWQKPVYHLSGNNGCTRCKSSKIQTTIIKHINTLGIKFVECDRKTIHPYEIDILIPNHNLGIEINGDYYHSYNRPETTKEKYRHYDKASYADRQHIKLLQFSEHEILNNEGLVKSMINHHLGLSKKLDARKCDIETINYKIAQQFLEKSHTNGYVASTTNYALISNDKIVSVLSIVKKKQAWHIARFATIPNHCVRGGFSKLLKQFIRDKQPQSIVTYANRRFSNAGVYIRTGFELIRITKPNYVYLNSSGNYIGTRQQFQKHKLQNILENFDQNLTEAENMFSNGYRRLWDAGHYKLKLEPNNQHI